jgi:signal transduction histidine kinase
MKNYFIFNDGKIIEDIFNNLSEGLAILDDNGKILWFNNFFKNLFQIKEDFENKNLKDFISYNSYLKYLYYVFGDEIKVVSKKDLSISENFFLEFSSFYLQPQNGNIYYLIKVKDVSKEKSLEKMKSDFISISAHQLRTPSGAIKWVFESLLAGRGGELNEEQKNIVQEGYVATKRLISLVNDLLDTVKIEGESYFYKFNFYNFEEIFQKALEPYRNLIEEKNIKFNFQFPAYRTLKVRVDADKIIMVIQNLLDNALKYTPPKGIVSIAVDIIENELIFAIQDSGPGILESEKDSIFKKFFRGSNILKLETEGNGLGLFVAKKIIEAHKGRIWFESKEGEGSTFYFTLPLNK